MASVKKAIRRELRVSLKVLDEVYELLTERLDENEVYVSDLTAIISDLGFVEGRLDRAKVLLREI